jgi:excisionase family DNA binding protein
MAQKFTSLDEAAVQLGISKDRLSELREANVVRGYRDGASWKFRSEDIERLAAEGIPEVDPGASDLSLDLDDEPPSPASSELDQEPPQPAAAANDEEEIGLADESRAGGPGPASAPASDLSLEDVDEPTVAGLEDDDSDDALALDDDIDIDVAKDSILLSEKELGGPVGRPPSTIIGKGELDLDADLDLSPIDSGSHPKSDPKAKSGSGSDLTAADDDLAIDLPSPSGEFAGLEELDVDLEAESSRILSPEDVTKAKSAAKAASSKIAGLSDLELAPTPSDPGIASSDVRLIDDSPSGSNIAGLSALELDDDEDDQVLGEGSDVTLSGESSGINIISPSDSGLALDEVALDLSGSAPMGSSLDLGEGEAGLSFGSGVSGIAEAKGVDEFQLTPLGEEEADEEKDSSQVIALDEISEESAGVPVGLGASEEGMLVEDFGAGLTPSTMAMGATAAYETPFSLWNVLGLASCLLLLGLCGMMTYDLLRNMWSWDGVTSLNSSLMDGLLSLFG